MRDSELCFAHDPQHAEAAAAARRLGGSRQRRERTIESTYDLDGLDDGEWAWRVIRIAVNDALALENSNGRSRTLGSLVTVSLRVREQTVLEGRLLALEEKERLRQRHGRNK